MPSFARFGLLATCLLLVSCSGLPTVRAKGDVPAYIQARAEASCAADGITARDCIPIVFCFAGTQTAFIGHVDPRAYGRLQVTGGQGQSCTGNWTGGAEDFLTRLDYACSNGATGTIPIRRHTKRQRLQRRDILTDSGLRLSVWSGEKVWNAFDPNQNSYGSVCVAKSFGLGQI